MSARDSVQERASRIKLLLMDCDGVLTDGRIWILENGEDQKTFSTRDGLGLDLFHRGGLKSGIISGRRSSAVERRAETLGISFVRLGCEDKQLAFNEALDVNGLSTQEVAYVGDDLNDIPLMLRAELSVAVADAAVETKQHAHYVTQARGGEGAIREVCELILQAQGLWPDLISRYLA